jgi:hypothetical protein
MKAFPTPTFSINDEARVTSVGGDGGMDLRDYFAAMAMQGMLSGLLADGLGIEWAIIAQDSYRQADAMMKARQP